MKSWTVRCARAAYYVRSVVVTADKLEDALASAIKQVDASTRRRADRLGRTFVEAIAEGVHADPAHDPLAGVPVPVRFTEQGEPPLVTIFLARGAFQAVRVESGDARVIVEETGADPRRIKPRWRPIRAKPRTP
jgi:hypothetical protein